MIKVMIFFQLIFVICSLKLKCPRLFFYFNSFLQKSILRFSIVPVEPSLITSLFEFYILICNNLKSDYKCYYLVYLRLQAQNIANFKTYSRVEHRTYVLTPVSNNNFVPPHVIIVCHGCHSFKNLRFRIFFFNLSKILR